ADKLNELYRKDRKAYEEKWNDIGLFVKYGMLSEEKFFEKGKDFTLLTNTQKEHFTLEEYNAKVKDFQTDKNGTTIYLYTNDEERQHSYINTANKRNYDVLVMNSPIDNHFMQHMEMKLEKIAFKRVDADVLDKLITKEDTKKHDLTEEETSKLKEVFEKAIGKQEMHVEVESLNEEELPVTITMEEWMRRMKDMSRMGGGAGMNFYGSLPDSYKVSVNANHKLAKRILSAEGEEQVNIAKQAYDLARISQGMLTGSELTEFVNRSVNLI
ncbi:MAG TPA: molecular chaperone HtpG, partial [Chitinophagaceae bacterium]